MKETAAIFLIVGFFVLGGNLIYWFIKKRTSHIDLLRELFPGEIERTFIWTNGAFTYLDLPTTIWLNFPIYYRRIEEVKLTEKVLELELIVRNASRKSMISFAFFIGYFIMFWLSINSLGT